MKITKSRLKEIIKEELDLIESSQSQALQEGLVDDAIQRLKMAVARSPEKNREELQDVLATIAQLGDRAPDALEASPGVKYTEELAAEEAMREMSRHDPDSGYDQLRQDRDDASGVSDDNDEEERAMAAAMRKRVPSARNK